MGLLGGETHGLCLPQQPGARPRDTAWGAPRARSPTCEREQVPAFLTHRQPLRQGRPHNRTPRPLRPLSCTVGSPTAAPSPPTAPAVEAGNGGCFGVPSSAPSLSEHTFEESMAGTRVASHQDRKCVAREGHGRTGLRFAPRGPPGVGQWAEGHSEAWAVLRGPLMGECVMLRLIWEVGGAGAHTLASAGGRSGGRPREPGV